MVITDNSSSVVCVVGLGYVGLPLAVAFGSRMPTIGYDLSSEKVAQFTAGIDPTGEVGHEELRRATWLRYASTPEVLRDADIIIVAVPTPVDPSHNPDFRPLIQASQSVGRHMKSGVTVVFESTVYPGATEEICIPVLEQVSDLRWKVDFHVGYSPERMNPGDRQHTLSSVVKVVAGDTEATTQRLVALYGQIVSAGIHAVSSIRVAEAAKVIENTQRDLNIALMNELALLFDRMDIDTTEVLEAASTKWNFIPYRPGLVGGHCIGVDPYYLTHKAERLGYHPQVILAGRRINDAMAAYVAQTTVRLMVKHGGCNQGDQVNILGLTFKENCPDLRNSKVADLIRELEQFGLDMAVHDPIADAHEAQREYGLRLRAWDDLHAHPKATVLAVAHDYYRRRESDLIARLEPGTVVVDVKAVLNQTAVRERGATLWRL